MSATVTPLSLKRPGGPLTHEQRLLARSVPGLAERVAFKLAMEIGGDPKSPDRIHLAHLGIYRAAQTFDPAEGEFPPWAGYLAMAEILMFERKERKAKRLLTAGRITGFRWLAEHRRHHVDDIPADASDADLMGALVDIAQGQLAAELLGTVAAAGEPAQGGDEIAEREAWAVTIDAVLRVLASLQPHHRDMLLAFAHGNSIKDIARARGADYSTLREDFHEQLALVRARLAGMKVISMPSVPRGALEVLPKPGGGP